MRVKDPESKLSVTMKMRVRKMFEIKPSADMKDKNGTVISVHSTKTSLY